MARDVILSSFAMKSCANPCRFRVPRQQFAGVALSLLSLAGHGCAPEREDFTEPELAEISLVPAAEPAPLAECELALQVQYQGARYDSRLILACREPACGGEDVAETIALVEQTGGHRVTSVLRSLSLMTVDVGSADEVLSWACRYRLEPAFHGAFHEAFPNLALDLR
jgi:hypothetical protein